MNTSPTTRPRRSTLAQIAAPIVLAVAVTSAFTAPVAASGPQDDGSGYAPSTAERVVSGPDTRSARPCFLVRAHWNEALDGTQPVC